MHEEEEQGTCAARPAIHHGRGVRGWRLLSDKVFRKLTRCLRGRGLPWGGCMVSLRPIVFSAFSFSNTSASSDARVLAYSFSPPPDRLSRWLAWNTLLSWPRAFHSGPDNSPRRSPSFDCPYCSWTSPTGSQPDATLSHIAEHHLNRVSKTYHAVRSLSWRRTIFPPQPSFQN